MAVTVIEPSPKLHATCGRCLSIIEFEAKDAAFHPAAIVALRCGWRGTFHVDCPVCGADVGKAVR